MRVNTFDIEIGEFKLQVYTIGKQNFANIFPYPSICSNLDELIGMDNMMKLIDKISIRLNGRRYFSFKHITHNGFHGIDFFPIAYYKKSLSIFLIHFEILSKLLERSEFDDIRQEVLSHSISSDVIHPRNINYIELISFEEDPARLIQKQRAMERLLDTVCNRRYRELMNWAAYRIRSKDRLINNLKLEIAYYEKKELERRLRSEKYKADLNERLSELYHSERNKAIRRLDELSRRSCNIM